MGTESNYIRKWNRKIKAFELQNNKCKICNDDNIHHLVFHHLDPSIKEIKISDMFNNRWEKVEVELNKCILLCENCHRELHYEKENLTDSAKERRNNKNVILSYKSNKCEICGYDKCNSALVFHHRDGLDKEFDFGHLGKKFNSLQDLTVNITKELDKCILVCSNCHRDIHFDNELFDKYKDNIYNKNINWIQSKINRDKIIEEYKSGNIKIIDLAKTFKASKGGMSVIIKNLKIKGLI